MAINLTEDYSYSKFLEEVLEANGIKNTETSTLEKSDKSLEDPLDSFKIRQLEQKQEFLIALTNMLFKKFEEIHPSKKFSKFEFTDLTWYKKLGSN